MQVDKMPPSTGFGEAIGAGVGFSVPIAGTFLLVYLTPLHGWLEVLVLVTGMVVAFAAMIAGSILGNLAAHRWYKRGAERGTD